jgi:hypothetical protein
VKRVDRQPECDSDGARHGTGEQAQDFYPGPDQSVLKAFSQWGQFSVLHRVLHWELRTLLLGGFLCPLGQRAQKWISVFGSFDVAL